ncbi:MAG: type II toxin-antitoxin system VapC family toxin [Methanomassiliicoccaceae archaeon]|nr:type II toxin-antitoxin system VapC family toxin [Methanomassiliicoccaceae archaeon]
MTYYLDSNVIIDMLRKNDQKIMERFDSVLPKDVKIPAMVMAELIAGANRGQDAKIKMRPLNRYFEMIEIIPFDAKASEIYGRIWADPENKGKRIGTNDLMIAATVISRGGILVTSNTKEFSRIADLHTEDWRE